MRSKGDASRLPLMHATKEYESPMALPIKPPFLPMEARLVSELPRGRQWQYEPKWDGFRCLAFRDGQQIYLQSKSGRPLARYFPDVVATLRKLSAQHFALDGELVIPIGARSSFDHLLMRVHPAASRVQKLAAEYPAIYIAFDLLVDDRGNSWIDKTLDDRHRYLKQFSKRFFKRNPLIRVSAATKRLSTAKQWLSKLSSGLDGVMAKRTELPYLSGNRDGMQKVKHRKTADCVIGGFRYAEGKKIVGSLLLGLYDKAGRLNHVGFTSSFPVSERRKLLTLLKPLVHTHGFTGKAPGGPSRWSTRRTSRWVPLKPKLVVEVAYDNFTGERFRHGTKFLRFRPDKRPRECTDSQVRTNAGSKLMLLRI